MENNTCPSISEHLNSQLIRTHRNIHMTLYSYYRSSCAYRVRIALNVKNIAYDLTPVHLLNNGGEQHSPEYKAINGSAQVPTLTVNELTLGQSVAICEYLEEKYPTPPLLPKNIEDKALVRQMCEVINSGIQPLQNLSVTQQLTKLFTEGEEKRKEWIHIWVNKGFASLEQLIKQHGGEFCFKDEISLADCFLVPQVFSATRFGVEVEKFPEIMKRYNHLIKMDAITKASPDNQPDAPSK